MRSYLLLDAGNTRITACRLGGPGQHASHPDTGGPGEPVPLEDLGSFPSDPASRLGEGLDVWLRSLPRTDGDRPVLVTVIPELVVPVSETLRDLVCVDHGGPLPFSLAVDDPAAVGPDRYCNVAAACRAGLGNALIVDAGTATTFDLLLDGVFAGGIIAPGMALAGEALAARTARLPRVPLEPAPLVAAAGTEGAMAAGIWHAGLGGVQTIAAGLLEHHGPRPVIVTGGLGIHLRQLGWYDPFWTLRGAAALAEAAVADNP